MAVAKAKTDSTIQRRRLAALVVWTCVVWGHSLMAGPESSAESGIFVRLAAPLLQAMGVTDPDTMSFIVRKCGHFSEYAILAVLAVRLAWSLAGQRRQRALVALWVCLVPFANETIQLFVPGRSGMFRDVLIDLSGAAVGALVTWAIGRARAGHQG